MIAPPWLPGVAVRRWISVPVGAWLLVNADGEFLFPRGTVVVQHHTVAKTAAPFETHVFTFDGDAAHSRLARAAAYRWTAVPADDPKLVNEAALAPLPGDDARRWLSPAAERELNLDLSVAGFVLPLSPRQLDAKQPALWQTRGWLAPDHPLTCAEAPRLAALDDTSASPELRVRSYLDANCAACHRPGGPGRGNFDARFVAPFSAAELTSAALVAGDLGITGAKLVLPGAPEKSVLHARLVRTDALRMPAISLSDESAPVAPLLAEWIGGLLRE